jgi:uncharacterized membrane protein
VAKKRRKQKIKQDFHRTHTKEDKKETVVSGKKESKRSTLIGVGVAVLAMAVVGLIMFGGGGSPFAVVEAEAGVVKLPMTEVNDGQAHYYTYNGSGKNINFFVLKSSDGVVRAAFDACDVCYREKKGYRQEGDLMVCRNCGQQFPSEKINVLKGGCNPAPLARQEKGGYLVLNTADIESGRVYF